MQNRQTYVRAVLGLATGLVVSLLVCHSASAQTPDPNPVTAEFLAGNGLAAINADVAYRLGWNGQGTTVAVVDTGVLTTHREFIGKLPPYGQLALNSRPWSPIHDDHGPHVAGTVAARKDGLGMHGVAYGANLLPIYVELNGNLPGVGEFRGADAWRAVIARPDITIINNSWGRPGLYLEELNTPDEIETARREWVGDVLAVAPSIAATNKLLVIAAGNESMFSPGVVSGLPFFDAGIKNNTLSVVAFDPQKTVADIDFLGDFTNLADRAEDYSIVAPGVNINSVGTASNTSYALMQGTSMAAPHVSGAAAVVQSAFRWMGGKELADVLLSTANRDYTGIADVMVTSDVPYVTGGSTNFIFFNGGRYAIASETDPSGNYTPTALAAQNIILDQYCTAKGYSAQGCDRFKNSNRFTLDASVNREKVFGQGILDLGKAIGGLGRIDGKRMADRDFDATLNAGLYAVDTKGYSGLWSNDIGEQRATTGVLNGQPLGLRKLGAGTLVLSGNNTYSGPTVAEGGMLTLTGSITGDALVRPNGAFGGSGRVGQNLDNQGTLVAGLKSGETLTVGNAVTSTGAIVIPVTDGQAGSLHANTITLNGGAVTAVAGSGFLRPNSSYNSVLVAGSSLTVNNGFRHTAKASPFLDVTTRVSGTNMDMSITALPLAGGAALNGDNRPVATALDRMFTQRDGSDEQRQLDGFYSLSEEGLAQVTTSLQGNSHAETLVTQPAAAMVNGVALNHLNQVGVGQGLSTGDTTPFTRASAWGQVLGGLSRVKGTDTLRSTLYGAVGGYDVPIDERWLVGGLAGFSRGRVRQGGSSVDINDIRFGLYTRFADAGWSVHGLVTAGYQHYDSNRGILVPGAAHTASSRFSGYSLGGSVEAGYDVLYGHSQRFSLRPSLGFDVSYTHQNSRKESGAGLYNLNLERGSVTQTSLRPGVTFGYALGAQVNLSLSAGYRRVLSGDTASIGATLAGDASQTRFNSVGRGAGRDFATLGIGLTADLQNGWQGEANVGGELSSRSQTIAGTLSLRYRW